MTLQLIGNHEQIVAAINEFSPSYHSDFFDVRHIGRNYLANDIRSETVEELAKELRAVLIRWGAGRRKAPMPREVSQFISTLGSSSFKELMYDVSNTPLSNLSIKNGARCITRETGIQLDINAFNANLLDALHRISEGLFVNNTNLTYPMKALLLITGLLPAFDSQVRKGLGRCGLVGTNNTQFLLPSNSTDIVGRKITSIGFLLGDCWKNHKEGLVQAIKSSKYPKLENEPGRVFDVLLFMQAKIQIAPLFSYQPIMNNWYDVK